jgi:hypothetical protein
LCSWFPTICRQRDLPESICRNDTADFISGLAKDLPPMMQVMEDIGGIELPESLIHFADEPTLPVEAVTTRKAPPKPDSDASHA